MSSLHNKRGLIVGIANRHSIAHGCAQAMREAGAELAITYLNDKAKPFVEPLAQALDAPLLLPCDVREPGQLEAVFDTIEREWGQLDFLLHSIAFAPREDLHGPLVDCSAEGFAMAMDVSCHSFIRMAKLARPLMREGGSLTTVSFYGAERVVESYNLMGPVKAALESMVRYLAMELGPGNVRVHAVSPGPILTRAGSGIAHFDALMANARAKAPLQRLVTLDEIAQLSAFLCMDAASGMSGQTIYVDAGVHAMD